MKTAEIKKVIVSQREEIEEKFEKEKIIEREQSKELINFLPAPNILAILGVRRCGKSILSWQIFRGKKFVYVNFDDERLFGFNTGDFDKLLEAFYELYGDIEYILLDEIQNVHRWELFANRLRRTKKVIITGSNSKLLSGELATHLTGRYIDFTLFPFGFREYLSFQDFSFTTSDIYSTRKVGILKNKLMDYVKRGGFPDVYIFGTGILREIYRDIIENDIIQRGSVKKKAAFREMSKYLVTNYGKEISFNKLRGIIDVKDIHTIKNWVDMLCASYLLIIVERFSFKLKEQIIAPKKVYCIDTGLIHSIAFKFMENFGGLMENLVAIELCRRKSYYHNDWEIYYWKDHQQREVDFVIKDGLKVSELIQVTYASGRDEIAEREIKALMIGSEELKCNDLNMITWDYEDEGNFDGKKIKFIPLWKWLMRNLN